MGNWSNNGGLEILKPKISKHAGRGVNQIMRARFANPPPPSLFHTHPPTHHNSPPSLSPL